MGGEEYTVEAEKIITRFGELRISTDLIEHFLGGLGIGVEGGEVGGEFLSEGRLTGLGGWAGEMTEVFNEPGGTGGSESFVDFGFFGKRGREDRGGESFLMVNWAGVHGFYELHDGDGEFLVAI